MTSAPDAVKIRPSASPTAAQRVPPRCSGPVGLADTNSRLIRCPLKRSELPYAAPAATMSCATWPCAPASTVMFRNPGPATSTSATPSVSCSRLAISVARSRGFVPAFFASCSATFVA